jgi:four helix bundle protein
MGYQSFKELRVWQEAKDLAVETYNLTRTGLLSKDYGLRDQMQKSVVSVACNIAEGYERNSHKDFIRFLMISKGSLSELRTQLEIAYSIGYLDITEVEKIDGQCKKLGAMITRLIQSRKERLTINRLTD